MKKRIISIFLCAVMLLSMLSVSAFAATTVASGTCGGEGDGTNLTWTLDSDGLLTISGTGIMADNEYHDEVPWYSQCEDICSVSIGDGVTSIGKRAFSGCNNLMGITIPDSVTSIGDSAFEYCFGLVNITVDAENTSYSSSDGILFNKPKTVLIQYPVGNSRTEYTIPNGVTSIGDSAFDGCDRLTSVTIPNGVTSIGDFAFSNCINLTGITIPDSVTSIGDGAFQNCFGLVNITVDAENTSYSSSDGILFNKPKTVLIQYPVGNSRTEYTIPYSVTSIGDFAFQRCSNLVSVTIPNSVTSIGEYAFYDCGRLTSITIPNSVTSIGEYAFAYCNNLTSATIPEGVTDMGRLVFSGCDGLADANGFIIVNYILFDYLGSGGSITIPDGVTSIGKWAFSGCNNLTGITIPDSVTSIGDFAFAYCSNLKNVTIPNSVTSIGNEAFIFCNSLTNVTIGNSVVSIGDNLFYRCSSLRSITIPNSVTSIGFDAFRECYSLTNVKIGNGVTSIASGAFDYCSSLTSVTIGNSVTSIGMWAFAVCESLTEVTIPETVTDIDYAVFQNCYMLKTATFKGNAPKMFSGDVFDNCAEGFTIHAPKNNTTWTSTAAYDATAQTWNDYPIVFDVETQTEPATPSGGGGGGGSTECTVSISTSQHGSVSADKSAASANQTVTLTVTPDKGYKLESLSVQSADGKDVKCRELGEGKYSFTMPKTDVTVSAVFTKDETEKTVVQNPFTDVSEGEYYYDAVLWALENDITTGIDRTHFGPNEPTTRAQVVTFLWRAAGCPEPTSTAAKFTDVLSNSYYEKAVAWAIEQGITKGTGAAAFSPYKACTRAQIVTFLARFAGAPESGAGTGFTDVSSDDYFASAVQWAKENGVTGGVSENTFAPNAGCTRAQVVTFLYRWMAK